MASSSLTYLRPEVAALQAKLDRFVEEECIPAEAEWEAHLATRTGADRWSPDAIPPCLERLKARARELGLWNLFIPPHLVSRVPDASLRPSVALSYREYGVLCESLGKCPEIAPEACNTSAPDTGNMEVLLEFGTPQQKERYLLPLLRGEIRSAFLMTEPDVASSDPTNLATRLRKRVVNGNNGNTNTRSVEYMLSGSKWWSTGVLDPRCRVALVVARMEQDDHNNNDASSRSNRHRAHTIVAVPLPHPGVRIDRPLTVFGYDDAPHGHGQVTLLDGKIRLTADDLIGGEGSGFKVSQARLGPGRIHHCMRAIGVASRSYDLMVKRSLERQTFGRYLWEHGSCQEAIADSLSDLESARLLTLDCAATLDQVSHGTTGKNRDDPIRNAARRKIGTIKVTVPELTYRVVDRAVQLHGGAGLCQDFFLAKALAGLRSLRIADGPDAVHRRTVARLAIQAARRRSTSAPSSRL